MNACGVGDVTDATTCPFFEGMSLPGIMNKVARVEGTSALYKGLEAQLLKTVLASAFTLTVKEKSFRAAMLVVLLVNRM